MIVRHSLDLQQSQVKALLAAVYRGKSVQRQRTIGGFQAVFRTVGQVSGQAQSSFKRSGQKLRQIRPPFLQSEFTQLQRSCRSQWRCRKAAVDAEGCLIVHQHRKLVISGLVRRSGEVFDADIDVGQRCPETAGGKLITETQGAVADHQRGNRNRDGLFIAFGRFYLGCCGGSRFGCGRQQTGVVPDTFFVALGKNLYSFQQDRIKSKLPGKEFETRGINLQKRDTGQRFAVRLVNFNPLQPQHSADIQFRFLVGRYPVIDLCSDRQ